MTSAITRSAKGEECQVRLPHWCSFDRSTVVWSHANGSAAGKGIGMKASDLIGAYACFACHQAYDRQRKPPHLTRDEIEVAWWEGHARSLILLEAKGLISTKRAA